MAKRGESKVRKGRSRVCASDPKSRAGISQPVGIDIAQILQNADEYYRAFSGGVNAPFMMEG